MPHIYPVASKTLTYASYDVKWIPNSAHFAVLGSNARGHGVIQIYELEGKQLLLTNETEKSSPFKCCTLGASGRFSYKMATGDLDGKLQIWDLERPDVPIMSIKAHDQIINGIDGIGGSQAPELVTGSRDGIVKIWDTRQNDRPVAVVKPAEGGAAKNRDAWCVAFGNSSTTEDRIVAAGYDNGDVKLFDLRAGACIIETNVESGVCSIEFFRKHEPMTQLAVASIKSVHILDIQNTMHNTSSSPLSLKAHNDTTVWSAHCQPNSSTVFMTSGGDGGLNLYSLKEMKAGKGLLASTVLSRQPISALDWHPENAGLVVCSAFDQIVRIAIITGL